MVPRIRCLAAVLLASALAPLVGCSSASPGEKMVQSYTRTRETLTGAQHQVNETLFSLHAVRTAQPAGLQDSFRHYKESVARLEKEGAKAKERAEAMNEETAAHVKQWQEEMKNFKDPTVKASMESRREAVQTNFKLVRMYADDARKAYAPFLGGNQEVVRALSIDLSPAAINSLTPAMDKIRADGRVLQEKLGAMGLALDNIAQGVSPIGEAK